MQKRHNSLQRFDLYALVFTVCIIGISAISIHFWMDKFGSTKDFFAKVPAEKSLNLAGEWNGSPAVCTPKFCHSINTMTLPLQLPLVSSEQQNAFSFLGGCDPGGSCTSSVTLSKELSAAELENFARIDSPMIILPEGIWFTVRVRGSSTSFTSSGDAMLLELDKAEILSSKKVELFISDLQWELFGPKQESPIVVENQFGWTYLASQHGHLMPAFISDITLLFFLLICLFGALFVHKSPSIITGVAFLGFTTLHYSLGTLIALGVSSQNTLGYTYEIAGFLASILLPISVSRLARTTVDNGFTKRICLHFFERYQLPLIHRIVSKTPQVAVCITMSSMVTLTAYWLFLGRFLSHEITLRLHLYELTGLSLALLTLLLSVGRVPTANRKEDIHSPRFKFTRGVILSFALLSLSFLSGALWLEYYDLYGDDQTSYFDSFMRSAFIPTFALTQIFNLILQFRSHSFYLDLNTRMTSAELNFSESILTCRRYTEAVRFFLDTIEQASAGIFSIHSCSSIIAVRTNPQLENDDFLYETYEKRRLRFEVNTSERTSQPFRKFHVPEALFTVFKTKKVLETQIFFDPIDEALFILSSHKELKGVPVYIFKLKIFKSSYMYPVVLKTLQNMGSIFAQFSMYLSDQKASESFVSKQILSTFGVFRLSGLRPGMNKNLERFVSFVDIARYTKLSELVGPEQMAKITSQFDIRMTKVVAEYEPEGSFLLRYVGDGNIAVHKTAAASIAVVKRMVEETRQFELEMRKDQELIAALTASIKKIASAKEANEPRANWDRRRYEVELFDMDQPLVSVRFGVNWGHLSIIIAGIDSRRDVEIKGDMVNKAARLEKAAKSFQTTALFGGDCIPLLPKSYVETGELRLIGMNRPSGSNIPIQYWELTSVIEDPTEREARRGNGAKLTKIVLELSSQVPIEIDSYLERLDGLKGSDVHVQIWKFVLRRLKKTSGPHVSGPIYLSSDIQSQHGITVEDQSKPQAS